MKRTPFMDLTTAYAFNRIFGNPSNKELLISLINGLVRGRKTVRDLRYNTVEEVGRPGDAPGAILNLSCTNGRGQKFVVEIHCCTGADTQDHLIQTGLKLIVDKIPIYGIRKWDFDMGETYLIVLMVDQQMPRARISNKCLHYIHLKMETGKFYFENLGYLFVELINFTKTEAELELDRDGWLYLLKNMGSLKGMPPFFQKPIFERLFDQAQYRLLNKAEKKRYDSSVKKKEDGIAIFPRVHRKSKSPNSGQLPR